jgi:radical SAM superfamily enzyme YgiQ (UPF0313 family)
VHATLFPEEVREHGLAHAVVTGDGDLVWPQALADCAAGAPQARYDGGRVAGESFSPARWDLLPDNSYMWASVQTVRGCPKHCSFCSVWRTDGQDAAPAHDFRGGARGGRAAPQRLSLRGFWPTTTSIR